MDLTMLPEATVPYFLFVEGSYQQYYVQWNPDF